MWVTGDHGAGFASDDHASGPNLDATPDDIIARIEGYSSLALRTRFAIPDLEWEIKLHCRDARQTGVPVSPTVMIDGLV